ncbi:signal recognition particle-docking protein FtsY [Clostridiaceae bacterium M8S5]|nr:signal recognition particle-docking protein FtsY [Clostridiaceae bacterium M8S5]
MFKKIFGFGKKKQEETQNIAETVEQDTKEEADDLPLEEIKEEKEEQIKVNQSKEEEKEKEEPKKEEEKAPKLSMFERLKRGLTKTRNNMSAQINNVLKNYRKIDEELFEDLEEILITADIGVETTMRIVEDVKDKVKERKIEDVNAIKDLIKEELIELLNDCEGGHELTVDPSPAIVLVVGVNGVGKTTTIGKLANKYKSKGKKVLIAAGDTFRAAAIEQLGEWANRAGVDIISHSEGADPAAVIYDSVQAAKARKTDILFCDTAGRLHNKKNLMNELNKIFRVVEREYPNATKEVLLVVDATTGQNAVLQAKTFKEACDITAIALTKLDGTAKGGVVFSVNAELKVPVKLVGVGERIDDLQEFDPKSFVDAIFSE